MPRPDSLQGSLDLLVLKILSRKPGLHGYALISTIQDASGEVLRAEEGSLYPALHRMEEAGWIRDFQADARGAEAPRYPPVPDV